MGTFKSSKTFFVSPELIPAIANDITTVFTNEGYLVQSDSLISGGYDISITKGGMFKAVLGMKTALKINVYFTGNAIQIDAGVGIFGQQFAPTVATLFIFWPIVITQIWGMVEQSKLDDKAISIAADTIAREASHTTQAVSNTVSSKFCTQCGKALPEDAVYCSGCGNKM